MSKEQLVKVLENCIALLGVDGQNTKGLVKKQLQELLKNIKKASID